MVESLLPTKRLGGIITIIFNAYLMLSDLRQSITKCLGAVFPNRLVGNAIVHIFVLGLY